MLNESPKKKVLFDGNVYDVLVEQNLDKTFFEKLGVELCYAKINKVEHENIPQNKENKKEEILNLVDGLDISTDEIGFFGFEGDEDAVGFGTIDNDSSGGYLLDYKQEEFIEVNSKNSRDRSLILLAQMENCIFITYDKKAYRDSTEIGVISFLLEHKDDNNMKSKLQSIFK